MNAAVPVVLDTVVLSNFAASGSLDLLSSILHRPCTVPDVRRELERGAGEGYEFTRRALDAIDDGISLVEPPDVATSRFREELDAGEAAVLALAADRDGIAATDDRAARTLARETGITVTGSVGILVHAVERGALTPATADAWIDRWIDVTGYYSPVESIEELL